MKRKLEKNVLFGAVVLGLFGSNVVNAVPGETQTVGNSAASKNFVQTKFQSNQGESLESKQTYGNLQEDITRVSEQSAADKAEKRNFLDKVKNFGKDAINFVSNHKVARAAGAAACATVGEFSYAVYKINSVHYSKGKVIMIMGKPCSGKGANFFVPMEMYNLEYFGVGNLIRSEMKKDGYGILTKEDVDLYNQGKAITSETTDKLMKNAVDGAQRGLLMDGFPRYQSNLDWLEKNNISTDVVIYLDAPDSYSMYKVDSRLTCPNKDCAREYDDVFNRPHIKGVCDHCGGKLEHRADDNLETMMERLEDFHTNTEPIIEYYENQGKVIHIKSDRPIDEVQKEIKDKLRASGKMDGYEDNVYAKIWRWIKEHVF